MEHLPIHWYQGLFVRPHHFQAADSYWTERQHIAQIWDHPYGYGLARFRYSKEALGAGKFRVIELDARMRDGTLVSLEQPEEIGEDAMHPGTVVYLCVPRIDLGKHNVISDEDEGSARYSSVKKTWTDWTAWSPAQEIEFRKLRCELRVDVHPEDDRYECLPIAKMNDAPPLALDRDYVPPLLSIGAWPNMTERFVRGIRDVIKEKIQKESNLINQLRRDRIEADDLLSWFLLDRWNESSMMLDLLCGCVSSRDRTHRIQPGDSQASRDTSTKTSVTLSPTTGVHPLMAYSELVRILGKLSICSSDAGPIAFEPYDHENLGEIFLDIRKKIVNNLEPPRTRRLHAAFKGVGRKLVVAFHDQPRPADWFEEGWQWYLGIEHEPDCEQAVIEFLNSVWTIHTREEVLDQLNMKKPGLDREPVKSIPDLQRAKEADWTFYRLDESPEDVWRAIKHNSIAIAFETVKRDLPEGGRVDVPRGDRSGTFGMRWHLFAVRKSP